MVSRAAIKRWQELHERWSLAKQLANVVHVEFGLAFEKFMLSGTQPDRSLIAKFNALRTETQLHRQALDDHVCDVMK